MTSYFQFYIFTFHSQQLSHKQTFMHGNSLTSYTLAKHIFTLKSRHSCRWTRYSRPRLFSPRFSTHFECTFQHNTLQWNESRAETGLVSKVDSRGPKETSLAPQHVCAANLSPCNLALATPFQYTQVSPYQITNPPYLISFTNQRTVVSPRLWLWAITRCVATLFTTRA